MLCDLHQEMGNMNPDFIWLPIGFFTLPKGGDVWKITYWGDIENLSVYGQLLALNNHLPLSALGTRKKTDISSLGLWLLA